MRKTSLLILVALAFVGTVIAAEPTKGSAKNLSLQIQEMLENNRFEISEDVTANVRFTLNQEGQIVVLSIDTENEILAGFVKGRLNYKKVELDQVKEGKIYIVPVRITS